MISPQLIHQITVVDTSDNDKVELFHIILQLELIFLGQNYNPGFQLPWLSQYKHLCLMLSTVMPYLPVVNQYNKSKIECQPQSKQKCLLHLSLR